MFLYLFMVLMLSVVDSIARLLSCVYNFDLSSTFPYLKYSPNQMFKLLIKCIENDAFYFV